MTLAQFRNLLTKLEVQYEQCEQNEIADAIQRFATLFEGPDNEKVAKTVKRIAAARAQKITS